MNNLLDLIKTKPTSRTPFDMNLVSSTESKIDNKTKWPCSSRAVLRKKLFNPFIIFLRSYNLMHMILK